MIVLARLLDLQIPSRYQKPTGRGLNAGPGTDASATPRPSQEFLNLKLILFCLLPLECLFALILFIIPSCPKSDRPVRSAVISPILSNGVNPMATTFPTERIERSILLIRGHKVLLDVDLAALYGVPTKRLNEQVRRNRARFPEDFMFQLTAEEVTSLRS